MAQNNDKKGNYAEAFLRAVEGKTSSPRSNLTASFVAVVRKRGDTALLPAILRDITSRIARKENEQSMDLQVPDASYERTHRKDIAHAAELIGGDVRNMRVSVNPALIGGFRAEHRGVLYDATYQKSLIDLYRRLVS